MRLTSMTIKNFKGIDEHGVHIDFAPITLLFGPNNAGKSTVIQALYLAREILCCNSADTDMVSGCGEGISLGSFKDYVHKHDVCREVSIFFKFKVDELPVYLNPFEMGWNNTAWAEAERLLGIVEEVGVDLRIRDGNFFGYDIYLNSEKFTNISIDHKTKSIIFYGCNPYVFLDDIARINIINFVNNIHIKNSNTQIYDEELIVKTNAIILSSIPELLRPLIHEEIYIDFNFPYDEFDRFSWCVPSLVQPAGCIEIPFINDAPFNFEEELHLLGALLTEDEEENGGTAGAEELEFVRVHLLSSLILGPGKLLKQELEKMLYIGPLRSLPARSFTPSRVDDPNRWASGLAAWDKIATSTPSEIEKINACLHGPNSLETGYMIQSHQYYELNANSALKAALHEMLFDDFDEEKLPLLRAFFAPENCKHSWCIRNETTGVEVHPRDMGMGITQVLPVIVVIALAKLGAIISIEQPELHIHPRWQTTMGDMFIKAIVGQDNPPIFLLETHSEHLLLRLLRRIRHTHTGTALESVRLSNTDLAVHWIGSYEGRTEVYHLGIDEDGSFNTPWPEGFFDERGEELFG